MTAPPVALATSAPSVALAPPMPLPSVARMTTLAPWLLAAGFGTTLLQWSVLAGDEAWLVLLVFAPAVATLAVAAHATVAPRGRPWLTGLVGAGLHGLLLVLVAATLARGPGIEVVFLGSCCAGFVHLAAAFVALPMYVAASHYGTRGDLGAGDAFLAFSGVWLFGWNALMLAVARDEWLAWLAGGVVAVIAFAVGVARGRARRRWCSEVEAGRVRGLRVRAWSKADDALELPTVAVRSEGELAVVERVEVSATAYRSAVVGVPVAMIYADEPPEALMP